MGSKLFMRGHKSERFQFHCMYFLLKTFVRIKMTCVNKNIEVIRGKKEEDPNHLSNFDLVRFLLT